MVNNRKIIRALLIISGLQFFIGIGVLIAAIVKLTDRVNDVIVVVAAMMIFSSVVSIFVLYTFYQKQNTNLEESMKNLEDLNTKLRAQRHDYLNHLQVVYGLMELEAYDELKRYLQPVYKDMLKTGKALKTSKPAINALLKAKMDEAESRGIDFYIEVKSDLKELNVEDWELCKVLSNLLDNAMTALACQEDEKRIVMDISEDKMAYRFSVSNNGPEIPESMQSEIFKQGITTKKGEGHGMGLFIVMNVLKSYGGEMMLVSKEGETEFAFVIPKRKRGDDGWNH